MDSAPAGHGVTSQGVTSQLLRGWRDVRAGDVEGLTTLRTATDRMRREQPLHLTLGLSLLARAHHRCANPASGRTAVAEALAVTSRSRQRYLLAELLRIDAELIALSGDPTGGAVTAKRAVETAVEMESPWLRDRALATLSALPCHAARDRERSRNAAARLFRRRDRGRGS
jgi:hypothetical protein